MKFLEGLNKQESFKLLEFVEEIYIEILNPKYNIIKKLGSGRKSECSFNQIEHLKRISKLPRKKVEFYNKPVNPKYHTKKILVYNLNKELIDKIDGLRATERKYKIGTGVIQDSCRGERLTDVRGYYFKYEDDCANNSTFSRSAEPTSCSARYCFKEHQDTSTIS